MQDDEPVWAERLPDDITDAATRTYMAAQASVQAAIQVLSKPVEGGGDIVDLSLAEVRESLLVAASFMLAANEAETTRRDIRLAGEKCGKFIANYAQILRETEDPIAGTLFTAMGVNKRKVSAH